MATLDLRGVVKRYGALDVLHGVDLAAEDGEFIVLVGPSGCGKSTLLRMIAGLEGVSDGEIVIGGRSVTGLPPKDRDIAMVFQSYALYPHMRVRDNMSFALKLARRARQEIDEVVGRAADILALQPLLERLPKELSGGQRQRVAMGRAIVRDPKVFLFDEPLSNLDAKLRVQMRAEIKALHQRLKSTIVYVTHDQIEAMTMADRIVVMQAGRVEQIGTPLELYDRPANVFVATFIGSPAMTLVEGVVKAAGLVDGEGSVWPLPPAARAWQGRSVTLGLRPEDIDLADALGTQTAETGAVLSADIHLVEPTGPETLVTLALGASRLLMATRSRRAFRPGERLAVRPNLDRLHLFDGQTGARLN